VRKKLSFSSEPAVFGLFLIHEGVIKNVGNLVVEVLAVYRDSSSMLRIPPPLGPEGLMIVSEACE
jgi:hypothetical protein